MDPSHATPGHDDQQVMSPSGNFAWELYGLMILAVMSAIGAWELGKWGLGGGEVWTRGGGEGLFFDGAFYLYDLYGFRNRWLCFEILDGPGVVLLSMTRSPAVLVIRPRLLRGARRSCDNVDK
ncbi:hypothetical protein AK812_SmicGene47820, partial [Symbiodinium microadriaticum]